MTSAQFMLGPARMRSTALSLVAILFAWRGAAHAQEANGEVFTEPVGPTEPSEGAARPAAVPVHPDKSDLGFGFGSYGRVGVGTDLRGSTPEPVNVVSHGARVVENTYTELDLYYRMRSERGVNVRTVTTLASLGDPFHYTGEFDAALALRNFYAEARASDDSWDAWIGSRMYRGDDIYLLDYWPLDDLNTIGGGIGFRAGGVNSAVHVGANRLLNSYQFQQREVADPVFGATTITELDRQRFVASAKSEYIFYRSPSGLGLKAKLYGEVQSLPSGTRTRNDQTIEALPSDFGYTLGAQLGAWGFAQGRSHANFFMRLSKGLTAFDELQLPEGFDATKKTFPHASELVLATSINYEIPGGGVQFGGYARRFVDADPNNADRDDGWEYIADVRPHYAVAGDIEAALDLSYQVRFPRGISPTALRALDPAIFQIAPMLLYAPFGHGSYARPQMRITYRAGHLNAGARDLYPLDDPRRARKWVHYLGLKAEWWFNSTYR